MRKTTPEFTQLKKLLEKNKGGLVMRKTVYNTQAKESKPGWHLYGKKAVQIGNRPIQPTYFAGVIQQKHYAGFYFMAHYSHPKKFPSMSPALKKTLKGKSCFHIKKADPALLKELDALLKKGKKIYKKLGWI